MKIAILHCRKSMDVCTGAACFKAYNNDRASFAQYAGDRPELAAFFDCGGCDIDCTRDAGMREKMQRLQSEGVEKVHIGVCLGKNCERRAEILALLHECNLPWEAGTHG